MSMMVTSYNELGHHTPAYYHFNVVNKVIITSSLNNQYLIILISLANPPKDGDAKLTGRSNVI